MNDLKSIQGEKGEFLKGTCLLAVGNPCFGQYAYNLAASIKYKDPDASICVFTEGNTLHALGDNKNAIFDYILPAPLEALYMKNHRRYPNRFKLSLHRYSPYDYTIYLDADSIWISSHRITELFDRFIGADVDFAGQCEDMIDLRTDYFIHKRALNGIGANVVEGFTPKLSYKSHRMYQLHGQFLLFKKTARVRGYFNEALCLYDRMESGGLTQEANWKWYGEAVEELALSVATATIGFDLAPESSGFAPVTTQGDRLLTLDPDSPRILVLSIVGQEKYSDCADGGYCVGENDTSLYIRHYNNCIDKINANSQHGCFHYPKKVTVL